MHHSLLLQLNQEQQDQHQQQQHHQPIQQLVQKKVQDLSFPWNSNKLIPDVFPKKKYKPRFLFCFVSLHLVQLFLVESFDMQPVCNRKSQVCRRKTILVLPWKCICSDIFLPQINPRFVFSIQLNLLTIADKTEIQKR